MEFSRYVVLAVVSILVVWHSEAAYFLRSSEIQRAKLCRESSLISRYDQVTQECYRIDTDGPCVDTMIFVRAEDKDDLYGTCQCKEVDKLTSYYAPHERCYSVYEKAYCPQAQILTPVKQRSTQVTCQPNPCHLFQKKGEESLVTFQNRCVKIQSKCGEESDAKVVRFDDDGLKLVCELPKFSGWATGSLSTSCPRGTFRRQGSTKCAKMTFRTEEWT